TFHHAVPPNRSLHPFHCDWHPRRSSQRGSSRNPSSRNQSPRSQSSRSQRSRNHSSRNQSTNDKRCPPPHLQRQTRGQCPRGGQQDPRPVERPVRARLQVHRRQAGIDHSIYGGLYLGASGYEGGHARGLYKDWLQVSSSVID
ncbi:hypothetical protein BU24DRAFT_497914, partial [Aaosphaeria arxii CBS 175.79]